MTNISEFLNAYVLLGESARLRRGADGEANQRHGAVHNSV